MKKSSLALALMFIFSMAITSLSAQEPVKKEEPKKETKAEKKEVKKEHKHVKKENKKK